MEDQKKILIIDDDPTTTALIGQLLEKAGYQIDIAQDGYQGEDRVRDFRPQLVICDIALPKVDGFTFCRNFTQNNSKIPLVIISSKIQARDTFLSMGVAAFLPKPIDTKLLLSTIASLIGEVVILQAQGPVSVETVAVANSFQETPELQTRPVFSQEILSKNIISKGRKILLVDDEPALQEMMRVGLEQIGYTVLVANNGEEGLKKVNTEPPDLIITDVLMPVMDGYALYRELKKNKTTQNIPVLIMTARNKLRDSFEALGVDFFITKPFDPDVFLNRIDQIIEGRPVVGEVLERKISEPPKPPEPKVDIKPM